jgi:anti-sigma factor RsiW
MSTCQEIRSALWEYYDDQTAPDTRDRVASHLEGCSDCRAILDEWKLVRTRTLSDDPLKAPPYLWTRIREAIERQEALLGRPWWLQWRWMVRVTLGTAAAMSLGAFYLWQDAPLEPLLEGQPASHSALQLASAQGSDAEAPMLLALGE